MPQSIPWDFVYCLGSSISDDVSTYFQVRRNGIETEAHTETRERMRRYGIGKSLFRYSYEVPLEIAKNGALFFLCDYLLGIEDSTLNFHHTYLYGYGTLKYLATISNILCATGRKKAGYIAAKPLELITRSVGTIDKGVRKQYSDGE